jgi:myo-inositol 2-dehydrogenase/D-chiro-inositol 1-dehydrogenase
VKIAIVGTGGVARRHLSVLAREPQIDVIGHVSSDGARAEQQAAEFGGRALTDVTHLLATDRPDAVWICVTPNRHGALERALIDAGVPFFVEKPLAVDVAIAEAIDQRIRHAGLVVGVGYKFRALDTLPRVRELLTETPPRMLLGAWHDAMPPPGWWRRMANSGGQIVEQATHLIDLARLLVGEGELVSSVFGAARRADADVPEVSAALLRFGDVPGVFTATYVLQGRQAIHLQLLCEARALTLTEQALIVHTGRDQVEIRTSVDPFEIEDRAFLDAVRDNNPAGVLSTYADALQTHRLCCTIRDAGLLLPGGPAAIDGQGHPGDHVGGG